MDILFSYLYKEANRNKINTFVDHLGPTMEVILITERLIDICNTPSLPQRKGNLEKATMDLGNRMQPSQPSHLWMVSSM